MGIMKWQGFFGNIWNLLLGTGGRQLRQEMLLKKLMKELIEVQIFTTEVLQQKEKWEKPNPKQTQSQALK